MQYESKFKRLYDLGKSIDKEHLQQQRKTLLNGISYYKSIEEPTDDDKQALAELEQKLKVTEVELYENDKL